MTDEDALESGELADLQAVLPPLLGTLEALSSIGRHLNPAAFDRVVAAVGSPDIDLAAARRRLDAWSDSLADVRDALANASDEALAAFDELRAARDMRAVFRALRHLPRAQEALYPLASALPPVSRYFLDPASRASDTRQTQLTGATPSAGTGVVHSGGEPGSRGGVSIYVPEDYTADRSWPLVMALHGGAGNGRGFLWSWLAAARGHGAIVAAPTAIGDTWALAGPDVDTPNLVRILDLVQGRWRIDPARRLLTGMSDGGTFTYVSGLEAGSPFTHLAPVSAAFHPFLAEMADTDRIRGLPIHLVHGALDWMFDVGMAREARAALEAAGANLTYLEIADLSHTWPREAAPAILAWLDQD